MQVSVIVPVYNRLDAIPETLTSLARQTMDPSAFEVVAVDDGSTDGTAEWLRSQGAVFPFALKVIEQTRGGPGAARNRGAQAAQCGVLLFWDSDMIAAPSALRVHATIHEKHARALVAGARRPWAAACTSTFSRIMYLARPEQDHIGTRSPSFQEVLSSNLSVASEQFCKLGGFDESLWAFEDLDLGYRAEQAGLTLLFSHEAFGWHNHPQTLEQACQHQCLYQAHAAAFLQKHPQLDGRIHYLVDKGPIDLRHDSPGRILRKCVRQVIASPVLLPGLVAWVHLLERWWPQPRLLEFFYWKVLSSYQLLGYRAGLAQSTGSARQEPPSDLNSR